MAIKESDPKSGSGGSARTAMRSYRDLLAIPSVRRVLFLGCLIRIPMWAANLALTLHVVSHLGRSYGEAGAVTAVATLAIAISGPWRGRILDRIGLRRTVAPSIIVQLVCWSIAPWVGFLPLLLLAGIGGLFVVPSFSILRQGLMTAAPDSARRTALSLDSSLTELTFMIGPAVGVFAATTWDTRYVLLALQLTVVAGAVLLWLANPPMKTTDLPEPPAASAKSAAPDLPAVAGASEVAEPNAPSDGAGEPIAPAPFREWFTAAVAAVLLAAAASTIVLAGTDLAIVAALRDLGQPESIGWVLALWGAGSLVGGLVYGAWHRSINAFWLLGALALTTIPVGFVRNLPVMCVWLVICGIFCAPTIVATVDQLSQLVHERSRGEAMGWHGSAMTAGSALGAPIAGYAIDHRGWPWGFAVVGIIGLGVAILGLGTRTRRRKATRASRDSDAAEGLVHLSTP